LAYNPYDYSDVKQKANKTQTYNPTSYAAAQQLAGRNTQTTVPTGATSYGGVKSQIDKAANTLATPSYQTPQWQAEAAQSVYAAYDPIRRQQQAQANKLYNASQRNIAERLGSTGGLRGGQYVNQLMGNEQARNAALYGISADSWRDAINQANTGASTALAERGLLQGQQQTAAAQLAGLLGQQSADQQWAQTYNAAQNQAQFANTLSALQAQAGENQFGANFAAQQAQQQIANLLNIGGAQDASNQYAAQLALQTQGQADQLALQQGALTGNYAPVYENMTTAQLNQALYSLPEEAQDQVVNNLMYAGVDFNDPTAARNAAIAALGQYGGQQTLAAQQQDAQQALAAGELTGIYNGQQTLPAQALAQQAQQYGTGIWADLVRSMIDKSAGEGVSLPKDLLSGDWLDDPQALYALLGLQGVS